MAFFRGFPSNDVVAIFNESNTTGDALDYNALRNDPAKNPQDHLDKIRFHSEFDYYELVSALATVTINHPLLSGYTSPNLGVTDIAIYRVGQTAENDFVLATHSLGYKPKFFVAYNGAMMTNGTIVQSASGLGRFVSAYATSTQIILREFSYSSNVALPAASRSYEVMIFREPEKDPTKPLFELEGGVVKQLGRGRIDSTKRYLRKVLPAESSFDIDLGVTMDVTGGRIRVVSGGNIYTEVGYTGSFAGPSFIPVGGIS